MSGFPSAAAAAAAVAVAQTIKFKTMRGDQVVRSTVATMACIRGLGLSPVPRKLS